MSKSIDALILTNKAKEYQVDSVLAAENTMGLSQLRLTPETVNKAERRQLWAGEIYIQLGAIAHSLSRNELPTIVDDANPLRGTYLRELGSILPEHTEISLLPPIPGHDLGLDHLQIVGGSLYTHDFLVAHPELIPEFIAKDAIADRIIATRRIKERDIALNETFNAGQNAAELLQAALADLDLIAYAFRRLGAVTELDS